MRKSDIKVDGTEYAVATTTESDELGQDYGLTRCTVLRVGVKRRHPVGGRSFAMTSSDDGVKVREVQPVGDRKPLGYNTEVVDGHVEHVVRAQAVKGTWDEHERVIELRADRKRASELRKAEQGARFADLVDELRGHGVRLEEYGVGALGKVNKYDREITFGVAGLEQLLAAIDGHPEYRLLDVHDVNELRVEARAYFGSHEPKYTIWWTDGPRVGEEDADTVTEALNAVSEHRMATATGEPDGGEYEQLRGER